MRRLIRRCRSVGVLGQGAGDAGGQDLFAALEGREPAIGQGEEAGGRGQAVNGAGDQVGRRTAPLGQGDIEGGKVEQQLQPRLGRA